MISPEGISYMKLTEEVVVLPEMRPYLWGIRQKEILQKEKVKFVYCTDNMLGFLFYRQKIEKTLFFYERMLPQGVVGINGSLYVCLLSKLHHVPIKIFTAAKDNLNNAGDKDATTLQGTDVVLEADKKFVVVPSNELVGWQVLR